MRRTDYTYGQLDSVLRSLGFTCRVDKAEPPARIYQYQDAAPTIILPEFPLTDNVLEYHLGYVRVQLEYNGLAEPDVFAEKLRKAG